MRYLVIAECPCGLPGAARVIQPNYDGDAQALIRNMQTLQEPRLTCKKCGEKSEPRNLQYVSMVVPTMCMLCRTNLKSYHAYFFSSSARRSRQIFADAFPELRSFLQTGGRMIWACPDCWPRFKAVRESLRDGS